MEPIWLKSYPPGVPAEIDMTQFRSLADVFEQSAAKYSGASPISIWARASPTPNWTGNRAISAHGCSRSAIAEGRASR